VLPFISKDAGISISIEENEKEDREQALASSLSKRQLLPTKRAAQASHKQDTIIGTIRANTPIRAQSVNIHEEAFGLQNKNQVTR